MNVNVMRQTWTDDRFDRMYRLMLQLGGGALAALIGLIAALDGVVVTQL